MFSKLKNSINDAVESAGGYEKIASQGLEYLKKDHNQDKKEAKSDSSDDDEDKKKWDCCPLTGNRKALLIGINYKGMPEELRGCINDVHAMKKYIVDKQGFKTDDDHMLILTEQEAKHNHPTRSRMLEGIRWLIKDAKAGDSLFFHFSGHGTRVPDEDGDEADGFDEALCPLDYKSAGLLVDDQVNVELIAKLVYGARLTIIVDCCHSGSVCDLPFEFLASEQNVFNWKKEVPSMVLAKRWDFGSFQRLKEQGIEVGKEIWGKYRESKSGEGGTAQFYKAGDKLSVGEVIMFSGCKDSQTSADVSSTTSFNLPTDAGPGGAGGACTNAFLAIMLRTADITYVELLDEMRKMLKEKNFTQLPCLSSSRKVPLGAKFNMHH
eukprot:Selendium_serpulae@DN6261_c4_g1_i13.p1